MTNKKIIKLLLASFGFKLVDYKMYWSGSHDGQFQNSLAYQFCAQNAKNESIIIFTADGFNMVLNNVLIELQSHKVVFINDENLHKIKNEQ